MLEMLALEERKASVYWPVGWSAKRARRAPEARNEASAHQPPGCLPPAEAVMSGIATTNEYEHTSVRQIVDYINKRTAHQMQAEGHHRPASSSHTSPTHHKRHPRADRNSSVEGMSVQNNKAQRTAAAALSIRANTKPGYGAGPTFILPTAHYKQKEACGRQPHKTCH